MYCKVVFKVQKFTKSYDFLPIPTYQVLLYLMIYMCVCVCMCVTYQPCILGERIIPYGQSFNIECQNSSQGVDRWTQDSNNITADTVGIDPSTITSRILHVQSMSLQLEGRYQCYTANSEPLDTINVYVIGKCIVLLAYSKLQLSGIVKYTLNI